jgi:hypothetical protein
MLCIPDHNTLPIPVYIHMIEILVYRTARLTVGYKDIVIRRKIAD